MQYTGWRKYLVAIWALVETFLFGGLIYGWAPVVWVYKQEKIYANLCPSNTTTLKSDSSIVYDISQTGNGTLSPFEVNQDGLNSESNCDPQDKNFALAFTIGSALFCASSAAFGFINYRFGTRVTRIGSMIIFVSGSLMFAFVSVDVPWLVFPGLTCIGVGGLPLLMTNAQISNLFITGSSTFIGLLCGAYDSSSAVQLIVKIAYENGVDSSHSYFFLTGLHIVVVISTFVFLPKDFIIAPTQKNVKEEEIAMDEKNVELLENRGEKQVYENTTLQDDNGQPTRVPSLKSCLTSPLFLLHVFWLCLLQLRFYYFLGSLNTFLHRITNNNKYLVSYFTNVMMYTMMGGLLSSMLAGVVYDWQRRMFQDSKSDLRRRLLPAILPLTIASCLALLMSILVLIPDTKVLYAVFIIMTLYRSFLYSVGTVFLSAMFPSEYFGMLYGVMIISGGIVGFLQFAFFTWAQSYLQAPLHADILCVCLVAVSLIHPAVQWFKCRRERYTLA